MPRNTVAKVDGRGRVIIPLSFRRMLNLKERSFVLLSLDAEKKTLSIIPFAAGGEMLRESEFEISDAPGSLAKLLIFLLKYNVDIVQSESVAQERGRMALWRAILDFSGCKITPAKLRRAILKERVARSARMSPIK